LEALRERLLEPVQPARAFGFSAFNARLLRIEKSVGRCLDGFDGAQRALKEIGFDRRRR